MQVLDKDNRVKEYKHSAYQLDDKTRVWSLFVIQPKVTHSLFFRYGFSPILKRQCVIAKPIIRSPGEDRLLELEELFNKAFFWGRLPCQMHLPTLWEGEKNAQFSTVKALGAKDAILVMNLLNSNYYSKSFFPNPNAHEGIQSTIQSISN